MTKDPIVAIALLTRKQLDVIGNSLKKVIPVTDDHRFDQLLAALDDAEHGWQRQEKK